MSIVTTLILVCSCSEDEELILKQISQYEYYGKKFRIVSINDSSLPKAWYGGDKYAEARIFIGAYNSLDLADFLSYLKRNVKWEFPDWVQLIVKEEIDFMFKIITFNDDSLIGIPVE